MTFKALKKLVGCRERGVYINSRPGVREAGKTARAVWEMASKAKLGIGTLEDTYLVAKGYYAAGAEQAGKANFWHLVERLDDAGHFRKPF